MPSIDEILNAKEFATLPTVASKILRVLDKHDPDLNEVYSIIESDPTLTIKLLKIANSPLYATLREISTVKQAIMLLGLNKLTNIVLGVSIFSKFWLASQKGAAELMNKFWWHSSSTGTLAKSLTVKLNRNFNESEFIGGLLHEIGKLALLQYNVDKYKDSIRLIIKEGLADHVAEKEIFGHNHIEVGKEIARCWKLPGELKSIITNYTSPLNEETHRDLVAAVRIADLLSELNGADFYKGIKKDTNIEEVDAWQILMESGNNDKGLIEITQSLEEEFKKSSEFLYAMRV